MPFSYFDRLTAAQKRVYRASDAVTSLRLPPSEGWGPLVTALAGALAGEQRAAVQAAAQGLFGALTRAFDVPPCRVEVLAMRPHGNWGELQGLYTTSARGGPPRVQLWMRTARQRRVVAFRTFLRTLLHELGHHLDYEHLRLADSFHTEGFYKRESSLFHQLVPDAAGGPGSRPAATAPGQPTPPAGPDPRPAARRVPAGRRPTGPGVSRKPASPGDSLPGRSQPALLGPGPA